MLQGIGTIIGAVSVIVAAIIGGNGFSAWRRQQLVQKRMALAERTISAVFRFKEEVAAVRSPFLLGHETEQAARDLAAAGMSEEKIGSEKFQRYARAQVYLNRINQRSEVWQEIEACRPLAFAYFSEDIPNEINKLYGALNTIRVSAQELADDDGNDRLYSKNIRSILSSSRAKDNPDELLQLINQSSEAVISVLKPFLREYKTSANLIIEATSQTIFRRIVDLVIPI